MAFLASQQGAAKRRRTNNGTQDASIIADPQYDETVGSSSRTTMAASQPRSLNGTRGNSAATSIAQGNTSAASLMGSTSTASGLRRSARNMRSVNEVIGGKMQEIFVVDDDDDDDDEAPPARPLAADLSQNGGRSSAAVNLAKLNGGSAATKGKRKAGASPVPAVEPAYDARKRRKDDAQSASHLGAHTSRSDLQKAMPPSQEWSNYVHGQPATSAAYDHRQPVVSPAGYYPGQTIQAPPSADWATSSALAIQQQQQQPRQQLIPPPPNHRLVLQQQQQQQQQSQSSQQYQQPGSSYRGGYAGGTGSVGGAPQVNGSARHKVPSSSSSSKQLLQAPGVPPPAYRTAAQEPVDDEHGHYIVREGTWITDPRGGEYRYKILGLLGQGTFGKVVECYDRHTRGYVAIKIIRAIQKYRDASQIEIRVLRALSENDPHNENKCIHLLDTFSYRNHVCIVSELLGKSVFDFLKENQFNPFPPAHIWSFAQQLLKSVAFLHRLSLIHTDLKPENILLVSTDYDYQNLSRRPNGRRKRVLKQTDIRLIDFGSATFNEEYHSQVVSTRHYRAPEIILNMGWSFPCDAWSIGCILIEFYTGEALFQTHDNLEHLAMMEQVLGPMPDSFRIKAETFKAEYFRGGRLDFPNPDTPKGSKKYVSGMKKLGDFLSKSSAWKKHNERFLHLLKRLMEFDPAKRIKVKDALKHPYFELAANEIPP